MVSSACLRLLIFVPAILIPACDSSSLAYSMMDSAYKLNRQGDHIQPSCTCFPILNQSVVPCLVLTVASWPKYGFLRRQVKWSGTPYLFKNFPQFIFIHTVKGFSSQSMKKKQMFFCDSVAFSMIQRMLAIWSLVPLPLWNPACTSESSLFMYC